MRISFERTGGVAGVRLACTLDTTALAPAEAARLEHLVDRAGLAALPPAALPPAAPPEPDRFEYRLEVDGRAFSFGERQVRAALRPLLAALLDQARGS
jgi:hypothetical protein